MEIFGENLLINKDLLHLLQQLNGEVKVKPFECVGTVKEVQACLNDFIDKQDVNGTIVEHFKCKNVESVDNLIRQFDNTNNLPAKFYGILKDNMY